MQHTAPPTPHDAPTAEFAPVGAASPPHGAAAPHAVPATGQYAAATPVTVQYGAAAFGSVPAHAPVASAPADEAGFFAPRLGPDGEPCASCGAPLAADQRYCLNCGERRAATRVPFPAAVAPQPTATTVTHSTLPVRRSLPPMPIWTGLAGVAAVSLGILAGVVLMNARDDDPVTVAATPTPTASVAAAPPPAQSTPAPEAAPATFTPDWPAGTDGWTVQLRTLPKDGTTPDAVAAAKNEASTQGAADVGALDSDSYPSLDPGQYVIYSTVSTSQADAESILDGIKANFPDAKVVEVSQTPGGGTGDDNTTEDSGDTGDSPPPTSDEALKEKEQTQTPEEAQKKLRDAPDEQATEGGELPEADGGEPGGGTEATEF
ncbi:hypothetical protein DVA67_028985 [Solirubrobacter sp. CPCC 204708]|uniref:Zinc ribbon domain-containing protein n=1 Tax=Solirubrobacter deserti TaxID=2282478 RepID=A0ABT4RTT0_9ACTN|nr:hypothetical protein [Solirubrobacter deserti]MBE2320035.1 hypothetical protein [Solirubrobacter deserti]MDA0141979.1 hypothetical protein [Solirubrobacter deserti]